MHPLVEEAMKKAAIAWLAIGDGEPYAVWCLWQDGALHVVSGPGEQPAPGLAEAGLAGAGPTGAGPTGAGPTGAGTVRVSARGDHGGRIVTWLARVEVIAPDTDGWTAVVPALAGKRLNASGTADEVAGRWARDCVVSRLVPTGDPEPAGPDDSGAAPPRETPAVHLPRKPFRLHRVRRPR